jgi:PIN domain nuclease of toxin-antitoxin system
VRVLLDTHVLLWALGEPKRLGARARARLVDPSTTIAVSVATAWEIAIKAGLGKLRLPGSVEAWLLPAVEELGGEWIAVTAAHAATVEVLPPHHRDPFDRMLVAQALSDGWTIMTADAALGAYGVPVIHA